jgi:hypothetical protein
MKLHLRAGRAAAMCAVSIAVLVGVAACGSSSPTSTAVNGTPAASTTSTSTRYEARLSLAKCLRSHGLNVPDPSPNGGVAGGGGGGGLFRTLRDQPNFQAALKACAKYTRGAFAFANTTPAQRAAFQQDLVKFAECMRAHNIDIPDPSTSAGGGFGIFRQIPQSERQSPAFQTAVQACSSNLPFRPGRGIGGGGATGGASTNPGA